MARGCSAVGQALSTGSSVVTVRSRVGRGDGGFVETRDGKIDWTAHDDELH
jgi:hypothetical protein